MKVALIVAVDQENGIGKNNDLMWHLPDDLKFFKDKTAAHIVIMGRKNWDSIPERFRPFSGRENVIITRNKEFQAEGARIFHSLEDALGAYSNEHERTVFIIGGGEIYRQAIALNCIDEYFITRVDHCFDADTFFPNVDLSDWREQVIGNHPIDEKHKYSFTFYRYTKE